MSKTGFWRPEPLRKMAGQAPQVELKVLVRGRSIDLEPHPGPARRVYFLDTPGLDLYRHGVIVRFRDRRQRRDDAVVKLRPVELGSVPGWLRDDDRFRVEIDALPGHSVCSCAFKHRLGRGDVARAVAAGRPLTGLLSDRQRKLLARCAPAGVRLAGLTVFGPIDVRCHNIRLRGLDQGLTAERWRYPDGSHLVELSTRCPVDEAAAVAQRVSSALSGRGVVPVTRQRTKTELALLS